MICNLSKSGLSRGMFLSLGDTSLDILQFKPKFPFNHLDEGSNLPHPDTPIILLGGKPDIFHGVFNIHSIIPIILLSPNYNQNNNKLLMAFTLVPSMSLLSLLVGFLAPFKTPSHLFKVQKKNG